MALHHVVATLCILSLLRSSIICSPIKFTSEGDNIIDKLFRGIRSIVENDKLARVHTRNETNITDSVKLDETFKLPSEEKKIEKFVQKESTEKPTVKSMPGTELLTKYDFPVETNNTEGSTAECVESVGCNTTSYCDKLSYTCKTCHSRSEKCTEQTQCCPGYLCNVKEGKCKKNEGSSGDACSSIGDCGDGHCCALNDNGDGACQPYLKEGDDCSADPFSSLFSTSSFLQEAVTGLPNKCPCDPGLQCQTKRSFPFFESSVCGKETSKDDRTRIINIRIHKLPSFHFHDEHDEDFFPLPGLLPGESKTKKMKTLSNKMHEHEKTDLKSNGHTSMNKKNDIPFPFGVENVLSSFSRIMNNLDDDFENSLDELPDEQSKNVENGEQAEEELRDKREAIEDVGNNAREAAHDAVDGIFDNVMKGIIEAMKYMM